MERIASAEWENYLTAKAMENVAKRFSEQALGVFNACLEGRDIKEHAAENGIPLSTAYRLKTRVKEALLAEIQALEEYLG